MAVAFLRARSKYGAERVTVDGQRFDSKGEAARYHELVYFVKAGEVRDLRRQVSYTLHAGDRSRLVAIGRYVADFVYLQRVLNPRRDEWVSIVEDFKGVDTPLSAWKRKHLEAEYGVIVKVTHATR